MADGPHHECGVFGVYGPELDAARLTYFGLFTLQHRGQESAGMAISGGHEITVHKQMGLVNQIFDETVLSRLRGHLGVGHVRYSTTGSSVVRNAQPFLVTEGSFSLALAHNGNLVNTKDLRAELEKSGMRLAGNNDTEIIARLLFRDLAYGSSIEEAMTSLMKKVKGAYSMAFITERELVACRDPHGFHPLCVGRLDDNSFVVASETCALNAVGARLVREVEPGEVVVVDSTGLRFFQAAESPREALCVFETIYFARPDSVIFGRSLHEARRRMGEVLAQEHPVEADVVVGVPDTGTPGGVGYAAAARLPFDVGLVKNRYIQRTFIQPNQRLRDLGARLKYTPLTTTLAGKRVVVVDDSIVRGTTTQRLVALIRDAGAREVHLRICAPPIKWPCFYGVDMASRDQLLAANHSLAAIRDHIGADSLGYLSIKGLVKALGVSSGNFCMACLNGDYPIAVPKDVQEAANCGRVEDDFDDEPALGEPVRLMVHSMLDDYDEYDT
ncbi:MAG TPA: amidophosphoribosyltransferase [Armatimonadetes bacterium]|nr:amidophosphoribosyltransferase [Armatimonadota bacterium]